MHMSGTHTYPDALDAVANAWTPLQACGGRWESNNTTSFKFLKDRIEGNDLAVASGGRGVVKEVVCCSLAFRFMTRASASCRRLAFASACLSSFSHFSLCHHGASFACGAAFTEKVRDSLFGAVACGAAFTEVVRDSLSGAFVLPSSVRDAAWCSFSVELACSGVACGAASARADRADELR